MKTDGIILPGGVIYSSEKNCLKKEKLIPLKTVKNIYNTKKSERAKKTSLKPFENESLREFSARVDLELKRNLIESDREAFRSKRSEKNKLKREKRETRNKSKAKVDNESNLTSDSNIYGSAENKYSRSNTNRPSFGDVIDSPPTFSNKLKEKLNRTKKNNENKAKDLSNYVESVRKAYLEIKAKRLSERNKYFEEKCGKKEKTLSEFGDCWVGIGKFRRYQD
ncbi:hypothetical protein FG379_002817 [Cryptosporidium bovis]|uniref:uncharacterized protein n=1 Tax=Cryptosporidium bovis TaxID=310047 RepID=UPI00351A88AC|nr:hypothetical protein FG379_002817 [Cryptosporidium bovis]